MKIDQAASALGRRGGRARAASLSVQERKHIASLGGNARARSVQAARRIAENFRYAAAASELRPSIRVERCRAFKGPLPGIISTTAAHAGTRRLSRPRR